MKKTERVIPRGTNILVKPDEEVSTQSSSGLATPDNVEKERPCFGRVIAVGSLLRDIKNGDRVVYSAFAGDKLRLDPDTADDKFDHIILNADIKENDVLGHLR